MEIAKEIGVNEEWRKKHYLQILINAKRDFRGRLNLVRSKSFRPPLEWRFLGRFAVFTYTKDGDSPSYTIAPCDLLIGEDLIEPAVPLSAGTVHKIHTNLPIENLKWAFAQMVRQSWLDSSAEILVGRRFNDSLIGSPLKLEGNLSIGKKLSRFSESLLECWDWRRLQSVADQALQEFHR